MRALAVVVRTLAAFVVSLFVALLYLHATASASPANHHGRWNPFVLLGLALHLGLAILLLWASYHPRFPYPPGRRWQVLPWVLGAGLINGVGACASLAAWCAS